MSKQKLKHKQKQKIRNYLSGWALLNRRLILLYGLRNSWVTIYGSAAFPTDDTLDASWIVFLHRPAVDTVSTCGVPTLQDHKAGVTQAHSACS